MGITWSYGDIMLKRRNEQEADKKKQKAFREAHDSSLYTPDDYAVRINGGHIESFNKINGAVLFTYPIEAFAEQEAINDIVDEFGGR